MEEKHVLLDNLGVGDEEALRAGCQSAESLNISMAARDVAPEVVDVLRRVLAQTAAQRSRPIRPLHRKKREREKSVFSFSSAVEQLKYLNQK